jgi:hypothetical protein
MVTRRTSIGRIQVVLTYLVTIIYDIQVYNDVNRKNMTTAPQGYGVATTMVRSQNTNARAESSWPWPPNNYAGGGLMLSRAKLYICLIGRRRPRAYLNGPEEILATYTQDPTSLLVYRDIQYSYPGIAHTENTYITTMQTCRAKRP